MDLTQTHVFEGKIITVNVSNESSNATFHVHLDLLTKKSPYFRAAQNFQEGSTDTINLTEMSPESFRYVIHWVYSDTLPEIKSPEKTPLMINGYATADRLMLPQCKNAIMDRIRKEKVTKSVHDVDLKAADKFDYDCQSPLMQFLVEQVVFECTYDDKVLAEVVENMMEWGSELALKLMLDLTLHLKNGPRNLEEPAKRRGCQYHDHSADEVCSLK